MTEGISRREFISRGAGVVLAAGLGGSFLEACGGSTSGKPASAKPSNGSLKGQTITVFADSNPQGTGLRPLIPEFEKQTGIRVNYQVLSELDITKKAAVALAAGNGSVDVTWGGLSQKPDWVTAGWVEPLDSYLSDTTLVGKHFNSSDFIPACWKATQYNGKHYGLPTLLDTNLLMYRKDILSAHHVAVPKTIDELLSACQVVNKKPVPAIALRGKRGVHSNIWIFNIFFYGEGGHYYVGEKPGGPAPSGTLKASLDAADSVKGLKTYGEFFLKGYTIPGSASDDYPAVTSAFKSGKAAMLVDDIAFGLEMVSALGNKVGFAKAPRGPAGIYPGFDTQMWFLAKSSKHKDAAMKFMAWSTSPEVQVQSAKNGKYIGVTRESSFTSPTFKSFARPDVLAAFKSESDELDINHFVQTPSFNVIGDYMSIAVSEVITGGESAAKAAAAAQSQAVSYLASHAG